MSEQIPVALETRDQPKRPPFSLGLPRFVRGLLILASLSSPAISLASPVQTNPVQTDEQEDHNRPYWGLQLGIDLGMEPTNRWPLRLDLHANYGLAGVFDEDRGTVCSRTVSTAGLDLSLPWEVGNDKVIFGIGGDLISHESENCGDGVEIELLPGEQHLHFNLGFVFAEGTRVRVFFSPSEEGEPPSFGLNIGGPFLTIGGGVGENHLPGNHHEWFLKVNYALGKQLHWHDYPLSFSLRFGFPDGMAISPIIGVTLPLGEGDHDHH